MDDLNLTSQFGLNVVFELIDQFKRQHNAKSAEMTMATMLPFMAESMCDDIEFVVKKMLGDYRANIGIDVMNRHVLLFPVKDAD
jgi:hypothetical protein